MISLIKKFQSDIVHTDTFCISKSITFSSVKNGMFYLLMVSSDHKWPWKSTTDNSYWILKSSQYPYKKKKKKLGP